MTLHRFTTALWLLAVVWAAACGRRPAGTLAVGIGADRYLTELPSRPDLGKYQHSTGVFDTLARMNERFEIEPLLAERWIFTPDTNTYRFELRKGVRFHDGAELTAADVKRAMRSASISTGARRIPSAVILRFGRRLASRWIAKPSWGPHGGIRPT